MFNIGFRTLVFNLKLLPEKFYQVFNRKLCISEYLPEKPLAQGLMVRNSSGSFARMAQTNMATFLSNYLVANLEKYLNKLSPRNDWKDAHRLLAKSNCVEAHFFRIKGLADLLILSFAKTQ